MPQPGNIVILAKSGRALAQSACRAGWRPWVVDAFGDLDTRVCAAGVIKVAMAGDGLSEQEVLKALARVPASPRASLIYGSGIEAMPTLLERLADRFDIIGNRIEVVRAVKDPRVFFRRLDELGVAYPATRFMRPENQQSFNQHGDSARDWLVKRAAGSGGEHVRRWRGKAIHGESIHRKSNDRPQQYFQQYLRGPVLSALFIADGRRARIVGYNTQWRARHAAAPFAYGGAINRTSLLPSQRALIKDHVSALTEAFDLRGLNSLDFVMHRGQPRVLEINPRPGATCELYEPEVPQGLLALHARACGGELPGDTRLRGQRARAQIIVYADKTVHVSADMQWPDWCRDLPTIGARIPARAPICTVLAEGDDAEQASRRVAARRESVLHAITARPIAA